MERQASTINDTFIPILDVTPIFYAKDNLGTSPERQAELVKLVKDVTFAMENIGFVQISGHNVSPNFVKKLIIYNGNIFHCHKMRKMKSR